MKLIINHRNSLLFAFQVVKTMKPCGSFTFHWNSDIREFSYHKRILHCNGNVEVQLPHLRILNSPKDCANLSWSTWLIGRNLVGHLQACEE